MGIANETVEIGSGKGLHVPPLVEHRFSNQSEEDVIFLVISSLSSMGDRITTSTPTFI